MGLNSITYPAWLKEFLKGKEEVPGNFESGAFALHSTRRYIDKKSNTVWETAITFTGRLVVREGKLGRDETQVKWGQWDTLHNVTVDI